MIVLEAAEATGDHAVAEEAVWAISFDETLVPLRQAEFPALPANGVAFAHQARSTAAVRVHAELALDDFNAGGQEKTTFQRCTNKNLVAEYE